MLNEKIAKVKLLIVCMQIIDRSVCNLELYTRKTLFINNTNAH